MIRKPQLPEIAQERYYRAAAALADIPLHEKDGLSWIMGGKPGYPRAIFRTMLGKRELAHRVPDVIERMRAGELPAIWAETPGSRPRGLEKYLLGHGFGVAWPATGMVLKTLSPQPPAQTDFTVRPLNEAQIPQWSRVVNTELFKADGEATRGFADLIEKVWRDGHFQFFAAVKDERVLGTATLYVEDDLAWIGHVAVSLGARRQGIGRQITWRAAKWAKENGIGTVALHASALGEPVYTTLGFKVVSRIKRLRLTE